MAGPNPIAVLDGDMGHLMGEPEAGVVDANGWQGVGEVVASRHRLPLSTLRVTVIALEFAMGGGEFMSSRQIDREVCQIRTHMSAWSFGVERHGSVVSIPEPQVEASGVR